MDRLLSVDYGYYYQNTMASMLNVLEVHANQCGSIVLSAIAGTTHALLLLLYLSLMVLISWELTLIAMAALALLLLVMRVGINARLQVAGWRLNDSAVGLAKNTLDILGGQKLVRMYGLEKRLQFDHETKLSAYYKRSLIHKVMVSLVNPAFTAILMIIVAGLLYMSTIVLHGDVVEKIPLALLFLFIMSRLAAPASGLNDARANISATLYSLDGMKEFLASDYRLFHPGGSIIFRTLEKKITLNDVWFQYGRDSMHALKGVTMDFPAGQISAIVGPSGSGKTTIIALLTRLHDPDQGLLEIDGVPLADIDGRSWRERIAVVTQDTFLFSESVKDNIRFKREGVSDEDVVSAARRADAHEFIMSLPEQYDTVLGDRGAGLSGGQQQRLAIARALIGKPCVLILDEATSNLDSFSELSIQRSIESLRGSMTIVVVAHRLATVRLADNVIVLEGGEVVEQGRHEELLARGGLYFEMAKVQELS